METNTLQWAPPGRRAAAALRLPRSLLHSSGAGQGERILLILMLRNITFYQVFHPLESPQEGVDVGFLCLQNQELILPPTQHFLHAFLLGGKASVTL